MTEVFPFPGFAVVGLRPVTGIRERRAEGGLRVISRRGTAYWAGRMVTGKLDLTEQKGWMSFLDRCVDQNLRIDWVHPYFALPAAYTAATWPLEAVPTLVEVTDLRTIVVAGLDVAMELTQGDRFSISQGGNQCYREIATSVTVTSATEQTLSVSPRLPSGLFTEDAEVHFEDPAVRLAIVADSWEPEQVNGPMGLGFEVSEVFR